MSLYGCQTKSLMNLADKTLLKKLAYVLVIKLILLIALWWFFIRDQKVAVDENSVANQFLSPVSTTEKESSK